MGTAAAEYRLKQAITDLRHVAAMTRVQELQDRAFEIGRQAQLARDKDVGKLHTDLRETERVAVAKNRERLAGGAKVDTVLDK